MTQQSKREIKESWAGMGEKVRKNKKQRNGELTFAVVGKLNACEQFFIRPHSYRNLDKINGKDFTDYSLCQK
jgi:hypothetical protein